MNRTWLVASLLTTAVRSWTRTRRHPRRTAWCASCDCGPSRRAAAALARLGPEAGDRQREAGAVLREAGDGSAAEHHH